ncbi:unnamed protein product [Rhizoctonia solani]|uniref:Uncharacterized protein n=1 Tax=Rhizoctonia solani TaxID=456999 RepID=A0A8H3ANL9_9AGAM|nr:unnamed protein product [Rhizoctonia solani]
MLHRFNSFLEGKKEDSPTVSNTNSTSGTRPEPDPESSLNNQHPKPLKTSSLLPSQKYTRHPKYYYFDGNAIFLIENTLFKVYSLQVQADPGVEDYDFEPMMKDIINCPNKPLNTLGTSDSNPVILPDVKITEFVHLLELVLGRPYDERYIKIITAAQSSEIDRPRYGGRITDAGVLAMRFGMDQLDSWAQSQILKLLQTTRQTRKENWSRDLIIKLALHIHDSRVSTYRYDLFGRIMLILSPDNSVQSPEQRESSLDACVNVYKNPTEFSARCPAFFGYVFMVMLVHGPQSSAWTKSLSRDERLVLYAAYTDLTYLSEHNDLETDWISQHIQFKTTCSPKCDSSFYEAIGLLFDLDSIPSEAHALESATPGDDLFSVFHIVSARWFFAKSCHAWRCGSECGKKTLARFDGCIERLLCGFTEKYKHYARSSTASKRFQSALLLMVLSILHYFYPDHERKDESNSTVFSLNLNPTPDPEPSSGGSLNYEHPEPLEASSSLASRIYTRHPKYYHPGGDVVFVVEDILFRVYSLQVQPDPGVTNFEYELIMGDVMSYSSRSQSTLGASDSNPIVLPNVRITEFVHLLEGALGRPFDERYIKLLTAAQSSNVDRPKYGARIMDAGILAMRFGMDQLDSWAQSQILQLLQLSHSSRKENWDQDQITKLALYIHESRISTYRREIFESITLILEPGGLGRHLYSPEQLKSNIDACLNIYKHHATEFSTKCPAFFGYAFIVLLSQGPQSPAWTGRLRRKERAVLSAACNGLIRLSEHDDLETDWVTNPAHMQVKVACSPKCDSSFNEAISIAFEVPSPLDSSTPLDDLQHVAQLASARWSYARSCHKWRCASDCGQKSLAKFDDCLERLLCGITEKYKHYARTA